MIKKETDKRSFGIFEHPLISEEIDEILEREIVGIGNGAHINVPKKHIGKRAKIIIKKGEGKPKE